MDPWLTRIQADERTSGYDAVSSNFQYFSFCMYPIAMHGE